MKKEKTMTFLKFRLWHKSVLCLLAGLLLSVSSYAQQRTITGTVTDKSGEPIPSVTVMVKGTATGTITDFDGKYSLSGDIPADGVLTFSFIGMKTQDVNIGGRSTIDVTLQESVTGLDEVVVVGYGTQQKKDVTGSVAMVDADQMNSRPNTQMGALIEGKAAGVQVLPARVNRRRDLVFAFAERTPLPPVASRSTWLTVCPQRIPVLSTRPIFRVFPF